MSFFFALLETFAQKRTTQTEKIIPLPGIVSGKGVDLTKIKQLHRWAEEKLINNSFILALIDVAKSKGEWERVQQYSQC
jgi:hypothetical protein